MSLLSSWLSNLPSILYYLELILQIAAIVHVVRTGRSWYWAWILFAFPGVGLAVYFFVEVLPEFRTPNAHNTMESLLNAFLPGRELKGLRTALEDADTVKNRKALADYYLHHGEAAKSVDLYRQCATGVYKDDPHVNLGLAGALVEAGEFAEAKGILELLRKKNLVYETSRRDLAYGRALEGLGQENEAIQTYESVLQKFSSEVEGVCRLAALLEKTGQKERARQLYEELLKKAKRFAPHYRREQQPWIRTAMQGRKRLAAAAP